MSYHRCAECGLTVRSDARRFTARSCPRCSIPLQRTDQIDGLEPGGTTISRRFRAEPRAAHAARRALEMLRWEPDRAQFHVAALLTTELVANAVEHACKGSRSEVRFEAALIEGHIRVAVGDDGSGFVPVARSPGAPLDSHWGLHLVDQLADRWGVVTEPRTLVWFELQSSVPSETAGAVATGHGAAAQC
jgi:anti-sigma regulatory factor (Ser/Thr protein kinase)